MYWKEWHDKMTQENRLWWASQGITQQQVDYYELGYLPHKEIETPDGKMVLPAYTIPIRDRENWEIVNIHYRLDNPPAGVHKYRYEHGIPSREFYACPGQFDNLIVVEGAKKAMVVYDRMDGATQVVGLPGCSPSEDVMNRLKGAGNVWLVLDPGCEKQEQRFKSHVPQSRVVRLPGKPDDLMMAGMTNTQFRSYLSQGR